MLFDRSLNVTTEDIVSNNNVTGSNPSLCCPALKYKIRNFHPFYLQIQVLYKKNTEFFNRPGVTVAVLQTSSSLIQWSFSSKPSKHQYTQKERARELKFWENVHLPTSVTCHVSGVMCHVSGVTCHYLFLFFVIIIFFGQSRKACWWWVCYQRGRPRLVWTLLKIQIFCGHLESGSICVKNALFYC